MPAPPDRTRSIARSSCPPGGPGFAGLDDIDYFGHVLPFRETHDIVTYDQRGTGRATPSLECPERDEVAVATLQAAGEPGDERAAVAAAMLACRDRLVAAGIDLDDYDSEASAADLDDLRRALGYDRWTILGISYGGRLALATMRSFPDGIESVILDSVYDVTYGGLAQTIAAANRGIDHLAGGVRRRSVVRIPLSGPGGHDRACPRPLQRNALGGRRRHRRGIGAAAVRDHR